MCPRIHALPKHTTTYIHITSNTPHHHTTQVVAEPNSVPVKKLGYELVRTAMLSVNDWEAVSVGLKADIIDRKVGFVCVVCVVCVCVFHVFYVCHVCVFSLCFSSLCHMCVMCVSCVCHMCVICVSYVCHGIHRLLYTLMAYTDCCTHSWHTQTVVHTHGIHRLLYTLMAYTDCCTHSWHTQTVVHIHGIHRLLYTLFNTFHITHPPSHPHPTHSMMKYK